MPTAKQKSKLPPGLLKAIAAKKKPAKKKTAAKKK